MMTVRLFRELPPFLFLCSLDLRSKKDSGGGRRLERERDNPWRTFGRGWSREEQRG